MVLVVLVLLLVVHVRLRRELRRQQRRRRVGAVLLLLLRRCCEPRPLQVSYWGGRVARRRWLPFATTAAPWLLVLLRACWYDGHPRGCRRRSQSRPGVVWPRRRVRRDSYWRPRCCHSSSTSCDCVRRVPATSSSSSSNSSNTAATACGSAVRHESAVTVRA